MQKFKSKDNTINLVAFTDSELIETVTAANHEIHLSRYDKRGRRDFVLTINSKNIYAEYKVEFRYTEVDIDINPTCLKQSMRFDYWRIDYHLEIAYNDRVEEILVLSLRETQEEE